ncbi:MAG: CapA family protein [Ignavibacteriales bacterium]
MALAVSVACVGCAAGRGPHQVEDFAAFRVRRLSLPEGQEPVVLVAVGDIMLSRGVAEQIERHGDIQHPFSKMKEYLHSGDIVFGNLECPLTPGRDIKPQEMVLRADPGLEAALASSGFTILSLANNHIPDFGADGIADTLKNLGAAGVECVGAGSNEREAHAARYFDVKGIRLAFLAYSDPGVVPASYRAGRDTPGTALLDLETMRADIHDAGENADFVVVSMHAGTEYSEDPDSNQVRYARAAVDAGADLVLGHHPHVVQRVERYRDRYIFYSLGNFVFDQMWSRATREGMAVKLFISKTGNETGVEKIEFAPVVINADAQPEMLAGNEAGAVVERLGLDVEAVSMHAGSDGEGTEGTLAATKYIAYAAPPQEYRLTSRRESDLDGDGTSETYSLRDGSLVITIDSEVVWRSPDEWWVDRFILGDANNDGVEDLNLSVWKAGSFGRHRPFWVDRDDRNIRCHLFIFDMVGGSPKPVWQSSNLDRPN